ncbi:MAG: M48 family metallopeptidase [Vulcanimicrobiaceae bacterium]|jgi:Zn-dependent protease with chaperone function
MNQYVHPKEKLYYTISLVVSILIYVALLVSIVGILYGLIIGCAALVLQGIFVGRLRGNGVRVTERQFPMLQAMAVKVAARLELPAVPEIYVLQEGGALNAFATSFVSRNFVVVYSDILELAYEQGEAELAFVLAHELAHVKLGHVKKKLWLFPARIIPFLSQAYSRACEYSCDAIGAALEPEGALGGILVLASGKRLYREMDLAAFVEQARQPTDFWMWLAEHLATHPNLPKRVDAIGMALHAAPANAGTSVVATA